jgi:hypothetical protein
MDAELQTLLIAVEKKIENLNKEITALKLKKRCPFYCMFGNKIDCLYKDNWHVCHDIDVAPGNSDAWCTEMIGRGIIDTELHYDDEQEILKDNDWIGRF